MSHSSYTASERRGIIAIGVLALLIMILGIIFSLCNRRQEEAIEVPVVEQHSEMIDTIALKEQKDKEKKKEELKREKKKKKDKKKGDKTSATKTKSPKTFRRRSPLDEPVDR